MQVETIVGSPPSPKPYQSKKKERNLLSASLSKEQDNKIPTYVEKTIYRSQKFPDLESRDLLKRSKNYDDSLRCSSAAYNNVDLRPNSSSYVPSVSGKKNQKQKIKNDINWDNLGEKIEDWFESAKTPDQKVVYRFLKELKDEEQSERDISSGLSVDTSISDKTQSLEDILNHLKKYRSKFNRKSRQSDCKSAALPTLNRSKHNPYTTQNENLLSHSSDNLNNLNTNNDNLKFESSTWRVMRHLKSADIRNKYPLPKANPDYHFRNATIFQTAGRPPKSTFLLHPDWV